MAGAVVGAVEAVGVALSDGTDDVSVTGGGGCGDGSPPPGAGPLPLALCRGPSSPRVGLSGAVDASADGSGAEAEAPSEAPVLGSPGLPLAGAPGETD
ncbi:hypothetical protein GT028_24335, partial [Streptomyces sp. SID2999]|nr:hypothetical protein [Streptomyces sp. SID2999]